MAEDVAVQAIAPATTAGERSEEPPRANSAPCGDERGSEPSKAHAVPNVGVNNSSGGLRECLARHHADVDGAFWLYRICESMTGDGPKRQ